MQSVASVRNAYYVLLTKVYIKDICSGNDLYSAVRDDDFAAIDESCAMYEVRSAVGDVRLRM